MDGGHGAGDLSREIPTAVSGDPEVVRVGSQYLLFLGGSFAIAGRSARGMRCLQGTGDFYVPMLISLGGTHGGSTRQPVGARDRPRTERPLGIQPGGRRGDDDGDARLARDRPLDKTRGRDASGRPCRDPVGISARSAMERVDLGTPFLRCEVDGHLAWCTIERPQARNALTSAMYYGIKRAVAFVNRREHPTALILTGTGDVAPGGELRGKRETRTPRRRPLRGDVVPFEAIRTGAPVVAAVNRIALAAGLMRALRRRGRERSATFRAPSLRHRRPDTPRTCRRTSASRARDLLFTGRRVVAERRVGLVARVVSHDRLLDETRQVARASSDRPDARLHVSGS